MGAIYVFKYQPGLAVEPDDVIEGHRILTDAEWQLRAKKRHDQIAQENATNAAKAEQHLKVALERKCCKAAARV